MKNVKIYSKAHCTKCVEIKDLFTKKEIDYEEIVLKTTDDVAKLKALYPIAKVAPFVVIDDVAYPNPADVANLLKELNDKCK